MQRTSLLGAKRIMRLKACDYSACSFSNDLNAIIWLDLERERDEMRLLLYFLGKHVSGRRERQQGENENENVANALCRFWWRSPRVCKTL